MKSDIRDGHHKSFAMRTGRVRPVALPGPASVVAEVLRVGDRQESCAQAEEARAQALPHKLREDLYWFRPQRHPNADLLSALTHHLRDHAIQADGCERARLNRMW